jgi:hypothetical protein
MNMKKIGLVTVLIVLWIATSQAQDMSAPVSVQLPLFLKILSFDRNLKARVGDEIVMAVIYQEKFKTSLNAKEELSNLIKESSIKTIEDIPIRYLSIDMSDNNDLAGVLSKNKVDILYIAPLRAMRIETITSLSRAKKMMTLTGVPEYVGSGVAVGIGIKGEKPQIIINLPAAKAEGADFSSQLLKLAKVIE